MMIGNTNGNQEIAKYTQVVMAGDPFVLGMKDGDETTYKMYLYAEPVYGGDTEEMRPKYRPRELSVLGTRAVIQPTLDEAVRALKNELLKAEIHRYRTLEMDVKRLELMIGRHEDHLFKVGKAMRKCVRRLEMADAVSRIKEEMGQSVFARVMDQVARGCAT